MAENKERSSGEQPRNEAAIPMLPNAASAVPEKVEPAKSGLHPAFYIIVWISLSSSVILFNKWILSTKDFKFPIILTTWHLTFATVMTQIMARFTHLLDSRHKVPMTGRVYLRAIVPIGVFFSLSLICGNLTYIYLSVSFIQMLKATTPVVVLLATWIFGIAQPSMKTFSNISIIVVGVIIASFGEIQFNLTGFLYQMGGLMFEAMRIVMVERLLSSAEFKMDPLVSLYYYAPACAIMNACIALIVEVPKIHMADFYRVGLFALLANAMVAFFLNVSVVFLISKTSSLVFTLSGVLKDILLVVASLIIFGDPVSGLQVFGYGIALSGLVYYKLGAEKLKGYLTEGHRRFREFGVTNPVAQKFAIFGVVLLVLFIVMGGLFPYVPAEYTHGASRALSNTVGSSNKGT